ncbi:unnamed protein product [Ranitomeya imitator]|uniref:Sulfotransferase n=1 Tax=Ranitomeya imitator TaxID=111125 RepID=A0ABN9MTW0_9NEOB|nr:unnamed protein product [Ranitomeya imitator]
MWQKTLYNEKRRPDPEEDCGEGPIPDLGNLRKQWTESGVETSRAIVHRRVQEMGYRCRIPQGRVNAASYQEILEHFMLPSAEMLYGDEDFIFQHDLAPAHSAKTTVLSIPILQVSGIGRYLLYRNSDTEFRYFCDIGNRYRRVRRVSSQTLGTIEDTFRYLCPIDLYWYRNSVSARSDILPVSADTIRYFQILEDTMAFNHFEYKGTRFAVGVHTEESVAYAENQFEILDDDVYNVTFPKSGTNWMIEILNLIKHKGDAAKSGTLPIYMRSPWYETVGSDETIKQMVSPRIISSHLPEHIFAKSFSKSKAKIIYTMRNPRDVIVSMFHFTKILNIFEAAEDFEKFIDDFIQGKVLYGSWFEHVKGWMKMKDDSRFFFITYEELIQQLQAYEEQHDPADPPRFYENLEESQSFLEQCLCYILQNAACFPSDQFKQLQAYEEEHDPADPLRFYENPEECQSFLEQCLR